MVIPLLALGSCYLWTLEKHKNRLLCSCVHCVNLRPISALRMLSWIGYVLLDGKQALAKAVQRISLFSVPRKAPFTGETLKANWGRLYRQMHDPTRKRRVNFGPALRRGGGDFFKSLAPLKWAAKGCV